MKKYRTKKTTNKRIKKTTKVIKNTKVVKSKKPPIYTMDQPLLSQIAAYKKYIRTKINRTKVNAIGFVSPEYFGCCNSGATIRLTYHPKYGFQVGKGDNRYGFNYSKMVDKVPTTYKARNECVVCFGVKDRVKAINYFFKLTTRIMKFNKEAYDESRQLKEQLKSNPQDIGAMLALHDITG